jgi:cytidylate kinase
MTKSGKHLKVIAIDGPAAAGKTTVARALADRLGAIFLDTGLLYRAVTFAALQRGIPSSDAAALAALVRSIELEVRPPSVNDGRSLDVLLDRVDITPRLRDPAIDRAVSAVAAHPPVRAALLPLQRALAERGPVVMVGRDITSVVIPDAGVKIYLDASNEERARRRYDELRVRGGNLSYDDVLAELIARDAADSTREAAPLRLAPGATVIDSNGRSIGQVVDAIARLAERTWAIEPLRSK